MARRLKGPPRLRGSLYGYLDHTSHYGGRAEPDDEMAGGRPGLPGVHRQHVELWRGDRGISNPSRSGIAKSVGPGPKAGTVSQK